MLVQNVGAEFSGYARFRGNECPEHRAHSRLSSNFCSTNCLKQHEHNSAHSYSMNSESPTRRRIAAAVVAAAFAATWAALQWPWILHTEDVRKGPAGAWLFTAYFLALSVLLALLPKVGRWLGLATGILLVAFISLLLPAAVGITQFTCLGAGWRCYAEGLATFGAGAAPVALCFRRFTPGGSRSAA